MNASLTPPTRHWTFDAPFDGPDEYLRPVSAQDSPADRPLAGLKHDAGKPQFACLDSKALLELGRVAAYGAAKYAEAGTENWRSVPNAERRYFDAAMRHLLASRTEALDPESGLSHLSHAAWNCLALFALSRGSPVGSPP